MRKGLLVLFLQLLWLRAFSNILAFEITNKLKVTVDQLEKETDFADNVGEINVTIIKPEELTGSTITKFGELNLVGEGDAPLQLTHWHLYGILEQNIKCDDAKNTKNKFS